MIVKNVETKEDESVPNTVRENKRKGCSEGLLIGVVTLIIIAPVIYSRGMNTPSEYGSYEPFTALVVTAIISPIVAIIAGIIGWMVVAWREGKREAEDDSS